MGFGTEALVGAVAACASCDAFSCCTALAAVAICCASAAKLLRATLAEAVCTSAPFKLPGASIEGFPPAEFAENTAPPCRAGSSTGLICSASAAKLLRLKSLRAASPSDPIKLPGAGMDVLPCAGFAANVLFPCRAASSAGLFCHASAAKLLRVESLGTASPAPPVKITGARTDKLLCTTVAAINSVPCRAVSASGVICCASAAKRVRLISPRTASPSPSVKLLEVGIAVLLFAAISDNSAPICCATSAGGVFCASAAKLLRIRLLKPASASAFTCPGAKPGSAPPEANPGSCCALAGSVACPFC